MGESHLGLVPREIEDGKYFRQLFGLHMQVKVFGWPDDACNALEHTGAADEKRNIRIVERFQHADIKIVGFSLISQAFHKAAHQGAGTSKIRKGGRSV